MRTHLGECGACAALVRSERDARARLRANRSGLPAPSADFMAGLLMMAGDSGAKKVPDSASWGFTGPVSTGQFGIGSPPTEAELPSLEPLPSTRPPATLSSESAGPVPRPPGGSRQVDLDRGRRRTPLAMTVLVSATAIVGTTALGAVAVARTAPEEPGQNATAGRPVVVGSAGATTERSASDPVLMQFIQGARFDYHREQAETDDG